MCEYICNTSRLGEGTVYIKSLNQDDIHALKEAIDTLLDTSSEMDYYIMLQTAYNLLNEKLLYRLFHDDDKFAIMNFLFASWLNTFYMWEQYHIKHKSINSMFKKIKEDSKKINEYCLACFLRKHITHKSCMITTYTYDILNKKASSLIPIILLDEHDRKMDDEEKKAIMDYKKIGKDIDVLETMEKAQSIITQNQIAIWEYIKGNVHNALNQIKSILPLAGNDLYNCEITNQKHERPITQPGRIVIKFEEKSLKYFPNFINETK